MNTLRSTSFAVVGLVVTACGVANSDPSLWKTTKDLGGTQFQPQAPGAGGETQGTGGDTTSPPPTQGEGGSVSQQGTGNAPPVGAGGSIVPGSGGTTQAPPPGAGGVVAAAGGFAPGAGGSSPGAGGTTMVGAGGTTMVGMGGTTMVGAGGTQVLNGNSGKCTFQFDVTTVTAHGTYAPANVGAIWITDSSNKFVKTLQTWGYIRLNNATPWVQSSNNNKVDAVTGATRLAHGALSTHWNCTNTSEAAVPDGQYTVNVTFAESDALLFFGGTAPSASVKFTKGPAGDDVMGTNTANFTGMHVKLTIP